MIKEMLQIQKSNYITDWQLILLCKSFVNYLDYQYFTNLAACGMMIIKMKKVIATVIKVDTSPAILDSLNRLAKKND